jgi:thiamine-phosphate pyrophosphorylase
MASQPQLASVARASPGLYLVTPRTNDPGALAPALSAALSDGGADAVLAQFAEADESTQTNWAKTLAAPVQESGAALLISGHAAIVARAGCDGTHAGDTTTLATALALLKPDHIVGAGGLTTRHAAMRAGEAGADYVMFGEPDADGYRPSFEAILERVSWWAELFVVPCVAYATSLAEVDALCAAGADFIAVEQLIFADPRGPRTAVCDLLARLHAGEMAE